MGRFTDLAFGKPAPTPAPAPKPVAKPRPAAPKIEEPVDEPRVEEEVSGDEESEEYQINILKKWSQVINPSMGIASNEI